MRLNYLWRRVYSLPTMQLGYLRLLTAVAAGAALPSSAALTCISYRTPRRWPKCLTIKAPVTVKLMMKMLMMLAASRLLTATEESSRAMSESVIVSREASKMMLLVAPAALTKFRTAKSIKVGISNGNQMRK